MSYKQAGVDIEAGDALVDWLVQTGSGQSHHRDRVVDGIGGFASLFRIGFPEMKKPCLVTCTDGVGTKVKLAAEFNQLRSIGQDLVAMCVNDLICTGGRPLLFLDYYAVAKLDLEKAKEFLLGVREACANSQCALVGGETAEMPGVYHNADFDCAGFAVGIVDEEATLGAHRVQEGDLLIGVSSSGFHSNGYSLLRKVFADDMKEWKDRLLRPTALYVNLALEVFSVCRIHAAAHITGGGVENIPRVIPEHLAMNLKTWSWPSEFKEVQRRTKMTDAEMLTTLNCGIGFVFIAPAFEKERIQQLIEKHQFQTIDLGFVGKAPKTASKKESQ